MAKFCMSVRFEKLRYFSLTKLRAAGLAHVVCNFKAWKSATRKTRLRLCCFIMCLARARSHQRGRRRRRLRSFRACTKVDGRPVRFTRAFLLFFFRFFKRKMVKTMQETCSSALRLRLSNYQHKALLTGQSRWKISAFHACLFVFLPIF